MNTESGQATQQEVEPSIKKTMTKEELELFVEKGLIPVTDRNLVARCVDGRDGITDIDYPAVSYPGANGGDAMVLFAAVNSLGVGDKISPQEIVKMVADSAEDKVFRFHTDDHAEGCGMGCGHMKNALLSPEDYGVTKEQMESLFSECEHMLESDQAKQDLLVGPHEESGVFVVVSETHGLKPYLKIDGKVMEAFVYQKTLHEKHLDKLISMISEKLPEQKSEDIKTAVEKSFGLQMGATLSRLAVGLPVIQVNIDTAGHASIIGM